MVNFFKRNYKRLIILSLLSMLLYAALFFTTYLANPGKAMQDFSGRFGLATNTILYMVESITTYYILIFHVLLPLLRRQRKRRALAVAAAFYIVKLGISYLIWTIEPRPEPAVSSTTIIPEDSAYWFLMWYNIFFLFDTTLSLSMALMVAWLRRSKQQIILEKQKAEAELSALKHQINPHFLFNSLSFIYSKILKFDEETADSVLILANIMRYALGKNADANGLVNIMEEVKHIENVIEINQRRHNHRLHIQYEEKIANISVSIVPLLLITLVENAFKHGDPHDKRHPILIHLYTDDHELRFYIKNKKSTGVKELSNGIGLKNINKQLQLMYGDNFTMGVEDNASTFAVLLKIPLYL
jgi:two-component system, LytTR family, sensor kinase